MNALATLIAALWAGSLWTVCGLVAPALFRILDDRAAGDLAGVFFTLATWTGAALAVILCLTLLRLGVGARRIYLWIALGALPPILCELGLRPWMAAVRAAGEMTTFGALHGAAALLYGAAGAGTIGVVLGVSRELSGLKRQE